METKICSKCGRELPATSEYFVKDKNRKDGLHPQCKECRKQYQEKNKVELAAQRKQYRERNKSEITEKRKQWYKQNIVKVLQEKKQYRDRSDKAKRAEYQKQYYEQNKEKVKKTNDNWRYKNKNKATMYWQKRRAYKKMLQRTLTTEEWETIKQLFNHKCAYCGETHKLTQDHFVPLSKGGGYTFDNIMPVCKSCNCSKKDRDFFEWYPKQDFYSKERETAILEFLDLAKEEAI